MTSQTVGLIGVGLLGSALAERLMSQGFRIVGYDVDQAKLAELEALGGSAATSLKEVAAECERVILCLPNSGIVTEVVDTIEPELTASSVLIDTTTGDPEITSHIGLRFATKGIGFLDATVAGSSEQARCGDIVMMVGGDENAFIDSRDIFDALANQVFHLGPIGSGAKMKLVVNLVLGLNRAVLAEGLSLARHSGIDMSTALDVLKSGAAYSKAMDTKGSKMIDGNFVPQARLSQHLKDVGLILEMGERQNAALPLSSIHKTLLQQAVNLGHGDDDNSAIIETINHLSRELSKQDRS